MLTLHGDAHLEPFGFIHGRFVQVNDSVKAAGLALVFSRVVELDFIPFREMVLGVANRHIRVEENARIGIWLTPHRGLEFEVLETHETLLKIADVKQMS